MDSSKHPLYQGFIAAAVSGVFFGCNYVPVKKFDAGDGMFFQWVMCNAVWLVGLTVQAMRGFPAFQPLAMLGGFLWATGNIMAVPIIHLIGMGQGILVWSSVTLLTGWATGRFGFLGTTPRIPTNETLNYVGTALALLSTCIYMFIKTEIATPSDSTVNNVDHTDDEHTSLLHSEQELDSHQVPLVESDTVIWDRLPTRYKRILGITAAVLSGLLYGTNFTPVIYVQDRHPGASSNGLDYVFSHFTGILLSASLYFIVYCALRANRPRLYPRAILPAIACGAMWGVAQTSWFIANDVLSEPVSFPIISTVPGVIAGLWGIYFKEIRGCRNLLFLLLACCITLTGAVLTALSKRNE